MRKITIITNVTEDAADINEGRQSSVQLGRHSADAVTCKATTTNLTNPTTVTQNDQYGPSSAVKIKPTQTGDVWVDNEV